MSSEKMEAIMMSWRIAVDTAKQQIETEERQEDGPDVDNLRYLHMHYGMKYKKYEDSVRKLIDQYAKDKKADDLSLLHKSFAECQLQKLRLDSRVRALTKDDDEEEEENGDDNASVTSSTRSVNVPPGPTATAADSLLRFKMKLPKRELFQFSGDVHEWLAFWASFTEIHNDKNLSDIDKFHFLVQSTKDGSPARKLLSSFPFCAKNYQQAKDWLEKRYGRKNVLVKVYVRDLLQLVGQASTGKSVDFTDLVTTITSRIRNLESLGVTQDKCGQLLYPVVESCLPDDVLKAWQRSSNFKEELDKLIEFLQSEVNYFTERNLAQLDLKQQQADSGEDKPASSKSSRSRRRGIKNVKSATGFLNTSQGQSEKPTCLFCDRRSHKTSECRTAIPWDVAQRKEVLRKKRACFKCLKTGHSFYKCDDKVLCFSCGGNHHVLMCQVAGSKQVDPKPVPNPPKKDEDQARKDDTVQPDANKTTLFNVVQRPEVLLQTLTVWIHGPSEARKARAAFNSLSSSSYVKEELAEKLGLTKIGQEKVTHQTFGGLQSSPQTHPIYKMQIAGLEENNRYNLEICGIPKISGPIDRLPKGAYIEECMRKGINLTDLNSTYEEIEVLIGADFGEELKLGGECVKLQSGPVAIRTKIGWVLSGRLNQSGSKRNNLAMMHLNSNRKNPDVSVMGSREAIGIQEPAETKSREEIEKAALEHFEKTLCQDNTERYTVHLPWIEGHPDLPDNNGVAVKRLQSTAESCLEKGPNLLELIPAVLTRFRMNSVGVVADIKKAFQQMNVADRDKLRFLWWKDVPACREIVEYRHRRVVFGVPSSPFLLGATLKHHLKKFPGYSQTCELLDSGLYVDNAVVSVSTEEAAKQFQQQACEILSAGQFELRGWELGPTPEDRDVSVLGIQWNLKEDCLKIDVQNIVSHVDCPPTKRNLYMMINMLFDPLGFAAPVTVCGKTLLKNVGSTGKGTWDEPLTAEQATEFQKWTRQLVDLRGVKLPRYVMGDSANARLSLHCCSDASSDCLATCVFLRVETEEVVNVFLLRAKTRVSPKKGVTIPRLELLACVMGARLVQTLLGDLGKDLPVHYWSDSTTALTWIQKDDMWATFVNNRVRQIRELSQPQQWRHIPRKLNPADLPSRGCSVKKLLESRWWEGPEWLYSREEDWPGDTPVEDIMEVKREKKKTVVSAANMAALEGSYLDECLQRCGSYSMCIRVMVYILRFTKKLKQPEGAVSREITAEEAETAEKYLLRYIQRSMTFEEPKKKMGLTTDEFGLVRVKTRLLFGEDEESCKYPVLLEGKLPLVKMLIQHEHELAHHAGVHYLQVRLREKFWIVRSRRTIRNVVHQCAVCRRRLATRIKVPESSLPAERIGTTKAFAITGVDVTGPLMVEKGKKAWVVLFTCGVYRAVDLELVSSVSTKAFIDACRKFMARRGRPSTVFSDSGTNFVGASNILNSVNWEEMEAGWDGWWERLIGLVKQILRRVLGSRFVKQHKLWCQVLLAEVEAVVNDVWSVKVADFPEFELMDGKRFRVNLGKIQRMKQELRERFRKEYLGQLVQRSQSGSPIQLTPGSVVLVEVENSKRIDWPIGVIVELFPGRDGHSRVARVKTSKGVIERPLLRLFRTELKNVDENLPRELFGQPMAAEPEEEHDAEEVVKA